MKKIRTEELTDFKKDLKKLIKRFRTLEEDLQIFIQYQLNPFHLMGQDSNGIKRISGLGIKNPEIYKTRKFACKSLKGRGNKSGIRVVYSYL